jgi:hypothetical protein
MIVLGERVKVRMKEINDFGLIQQRDYGGRPPCRIRGGPIRVHVTRFSMSLNLE